MSRLVFFPPPVALSLTPTLFDAFLLAHRSPRPLLKLPAFERARALFAASLDAALADALDLLARFSSLDGRLALLEAARAVSFSLADAATLPPADLAAHLLTLRHTDARVASVLARARLRLAVLDAPVFTYELVARDPRRANPRAACEASVRAFLGARASWSDVVAHEDDAGSLHFALLSMDDAEVVACVDPQTGPAPRLQRPLRYDRVWVDVAGGRIGITTYHPRDVRALAAAFGVALFDDALFYSDRPAFTTRHFEALGAAGLAAARLPAPVTRARAIGCTRALGGEGQLSTGGPRAFGLLEDSSRVGGGYLSGLRLRCDVTGETEAVDIDLRLPGRFACSSPRWEPAVRTAMADPLGFFAPGARADDAWSLFPLRHAEWRLREALGTERLDALVRAKVAKRVVSRHVTSAELRAQGSNVVTFPVPGEDGVHYAISDDPSVPARDVTEKERELWEIDVAKLAALRAKEMRLEGKVAVREDSSVARVGVLRADATSLVFFAVLRMPANAAERATLVKELKDEALPGHAVLLLPRGRGWGSGLFEVDYEGLVEGGVELVARAVGMAHLEDAIAPGRLTDAALVVQQKTRKIWFHGVAMEDVADSGYAMIEGLALRPGKTSSARDVSKWISPARDDVAVAKTTRPKIIRWMVSSFEKAGKKAPVEEIEGVIVVDGKKGYRLGVSVKVV